MAKSNGLMSGKKRRPEEDEMYYDNYQTHKRYLTEVMASSMIGLSVNGSALGNKFQSSPVSDRVMSPAETPCAVSRSTSPFPSQGDETSTLDSLMSEDSDDSIGFRFSRCVEAAPQCLHSAPCDFVSSHLLNNPRSHSPRQLQKLKCAVSPETVSGSAAALMSASCRTPATPFWPRFPETEGRLPPSPNDPSQASDLRKATLLRNLSLKAYQTNLSDCSEMDASKTYGSTESCVEAAGEVSPNVVSESYREYAVERVGCNTSVLMGSPMHGPVPSHVARGSSRVRSLVLGESPSRTKDCSSSETSTSVEKADNAMTKLEKSSRACEDDISHCKRSRSPLSPRSPIGVGSSNFDVSTMDGNISDTESSFGNASELASLCAQ